MMTAKEFKCIERKDGKRNIIDMNGNILSPNYWFRDVIIGQYGYIIVQRDDYLLNLLNEKGEILFQDKWFCGIWHICNGVFVADTPHRIYYLIDINGEILMNGKPLMSTTYSENNIEKIIVKDENHLYNIYDIKTRKLILEQWASFIRPWSTDRYACVLCAETYLWNYVDEKGDFLSKDKWFKNCYSFECGFGRVQREDGKWNFINRYGTLISNIWFEDASYYKGKPQGRIGSIIYYCYDNVFHHKLL